MSAQERALAREKLLYDQLLDRLAPDIPVLQRVAGALAEIDLLATFAERAHVLDFTAPELAAEPVIEIDGGRHPVVEAQVDNFIANDARLNAARQMLLVTGPNMKADAPKADDAKSTPTAPTGDTKKDPKQPG